MGKKYASYHVRTDNNSVVLESVKSYLRNKSRVNDNTEHAVQSLSNPIAKKMMERFLNLDQSMVSIVLSEKFISIYDEALSFETINEAAKQISKKIEAPVFYISNFDDDVLIMGIVQSGRTKAKKHIGPGLLSYDINPIRSNMYLIHTIKEFSYLSGNLKFVISDDIDECEVSVENEIGLSVNLTTDYLEEHSDSYKLVETNQAFKLYRMS